MGKENDNVENHCHESLRELRSFNDPNLHSINEILNNCFDKVHSRFNVTIFQESLYL